LIGRSGLQPGKDIDIVFTGLRPGEKLYEELYWEGEGIVPTDNRKITMLKPNGQGCNGVFQRIKELEEHIVRSDMEGTLRLLREIVPEASIENGLNA